MPLRPLPPGPLVAPSIIAADFADLGDACAHALGDGGADLLHLDVMDGHFVPNLTIGPDHCAALRRRLPHAFLDVHLMVTDPGMFIQPFARAGADVLTIHVEAVGESRVPDLVGRIRAAGCGAGLAINPPTPVERVLGVAAHADWLLVMSVNPGFSGQAFIPGVLDKTRRLRERLLPHQRLEMDGGIAPANAASVREAGCDVLVLGSAYFGRPPADRTGIALAARGAPRATASGSRSSAPAG